MQIAGNQRRLSVRVSQAGSASWNAAYLRGLDLPLPRLVMDFENDVYGTDDPVATVGDILTFSRASTKVYQPEGGGSATALNDVPTFDWSSGRRGLHLSYGVGAEAADLAQIALGPWWNGAAATVVMECNLLANQGNFDRLLEVNDASSSNRISVFYNALAGQNGCVVASGGASQAALATGATAYTPGSPSHFATSTAANAFLFTQNGGSVLSDMSGSMPAGVSQINLGSSHNGNRGEIVIYKLLCFDSALSASDIAALTV